MSAETATFQYEALFAPGVSAPESRFTGYPTYNFVGGHNDPEQIPAEALARSAQAVLERHAHLLAMYNLGQGPLGFTELRDFLAEKLATKRGVQCSRDDILITTGSSQGIDLVNKIFFEPGATVLMERFTYSAAINKARAAGLEVVGMPLDKHGLQTDELASLLSRLRDANVKPKYIYTIPTIQNPTGTILPLERRLHLVQLSKEFGIPIFEDECYADVLWVQEAPPALYALAPSQVVHIGSFSKSLAPALRVGYAVAGWELLGRMVALKSDGGTGALDQMVASEYFRQHFDQHMRTLSSALKLKRDVMLDAVQEQFGTSAEIWVPQGGIFMWLKLPDHVDVRTFAGKALEAGVAFNPGPDWACDGPGSKSYLRLCFALPSVEQIRRGVAELARICFEHTGVPEHSGNVPRSNL